MCDEFCPLSKENHVESSEAKQFKARFRNGLEIKAINQTYPHNDTPGGHAKVGS